MSFQLKMEQFEGPLDLLLSLIEDKKLHVSEISLATVTEDYLTYINEKTGESGNPAIMRDYSEFIVIAATLILIKARSLLPAIELSPDETESIDDLTERLRLYEIMVRYGELLKKQWSLIPILFSGNPPKEKKLPVFAPHASVSAELLLLTVQELCNTLPITEKKPEHAVHKTITLAEVMHRVESAIQSGITFRMSDATDRYHQATDPTEKREAKVFAVLSFLAILEMIKKTQVMVQQNDTFQDIVVSPYQS